MWEKARPVLILVVLGFIVWRVITVQNTKEETAESTPARAIAVLYPTEGSSARGAAVFLAVEEGIRVIVDMEGLTPGEHGFHVHEYGDCSAQDGTSAGGHFNPTGVSHGAPEDEEHHVGDLGNITADGQGVAHLNRVFSYLTFEGSESILGRGVIVHAGADDFISQPTGAAGARVACGVIGIAASD
jgi:Cu-Zn family superoxide dismutase